MRLRVLAVALFAVACSKPSQVVPEPPAVKVTMPEVADGGEAVEPKASTGAEPGAEAIAPGPEVTTPEAGPDAGAAIAAPDAGVVAAPKQPQAQPGKTGEKPAPGATEKPSAGTTEKPAPEAKKPPTTTPAPAQRAPAQVVLDKGGKQGVITFNHEAHQKVAKCADCHHTMKEGGKAQACRSCHGQADEGAKLSWKNAAHKTCRDCHKAKGAPTACNGCHKK